MVNIEADSTSNGNNFRAERKKTQIKVHKILYWRFSQKSWYELPKIKKGYRAALVGGVLYCHTQCFVGHDRY